MNSQHLSDEAVAAFADGVLRGHARERAARHVERCAECHRAVRSQREAVLVLRAAPAPPLPTGLFERLQALPSTTSVETLPTVLAADGSTMLATFAALPAAALVPQARPPRGTARQSSRRPAEQSPGSGEQDDDPDQARSGHRSRPLITGAAVVALTAGALAGVAAARPGDAPAVPGPATVDTRQGSTTTPVFTGAYFLRR